MSENTKPEIACIALKALDWARGSWGQMEYDKPKYDAETMALIYEAIANGANAISEGYRTKK